MSVGNESRAEPLLIPLLLSLAAGVLVWVATSLYGPGLTPDAVAYVSVARHLLEGNGFVLWNGAPCVDWPPLYPALLAAAAWAGNVDPVVAARPLQAGLFALVVFLSWQFLARHVRGPRPVLILGGLALLFAPAVVRVSRMVWSEPLFLVLTLVFLGLLESYWERPGRIRLLGAAAVAALACLTRYIGVTLVFAGVIVLLARHCRKPGEALKATAAFGLVAVYPLSLWLVRNVALTGTMMGRRPPSEVGLAEAFSLAGWTAAEWTFASEPGASLILAGFSAVLLVTALVATGARPTGAAVWKGLLRSLRLLPAVVFVCVYVLFLVASATRTAFDPIGHRLLAPVQPFFLAFLVVLASALFRALHHRLPHLRLRQVTVFVFAAWLTIPLVVVWRDLALWTSEGAGGYSVREWKESATVHHLRRDSWENRLPLYSNAPDLSYALAGVPAEFAPRRPGRFGEDGEEECWPSQPGWLVWFANIRRGYVYDPEELSRIARLEPRIRLDDGTIYRVRPRRLNDRSPSLGIAPCSALLRPGSPASAPSG